MEISEQVASILSKSILVVNEYLLLDLPPPSRPLGSSQVRATKSVDTLSYPARRRVSRAPPTAPAEVISTCQTKFISGVWW